jgi:hypothetical protein
MTKKKIAASPAVSRRDGVARTGRGGAGRGGSVLSR